MGIIADTMNWGKVNIINLRTALYHVGNGPRHEIPALGMGSLNVLNLIGQEAAPKAQVVFPAISWAFVACLAAVTANGVLVRTIPR